MKLHQISQNNLTFLGFEPSQINQKYFFNIHSLVTFSLCGLCSALTFLFLVFEAQHFVEYVEATYILSAAVATIVALAFLKVKILFKYIEELEKIIDSRKKSSSKKIYNETNQKVEKWGRIISFLGIKIIPLFGPLSLFIPSYFFYFTTDWGRGAFILPVPMWYPFDWKNPYGYMIAMILQYLMGACGFTFFTTMLSLGLGSYFFVIALVKDMKQMLYDFDKYAKIKGNKVRMLKKLHDFVQFHSDAKQAIKHFSEVYQLIFAALFSWSLITICGALLIVQTEISSHHGINSLVLIVMVMEVCCAFGWLLISCEVGERFCAKFDEVTDAIDQLKWYSFPIDVQQTLLTITIIGRHPIILECFGSILCIRDAFKRVINTAFSYFMVLREFSI